MRKMSRQEAGMIGYMKTRKYLEATKRKQKEEALRKYKEKSPKCQFCGKDLPYEKRRNKYCDHICSARANKRGYKRKCLNCGRPTPNLKYCGPACVSEHKWKIWKKRVLEMGYFPGKYGNSTCRVPKRLLVELRGHRCELCGRRKWLGKPIPLVFDHINGDSSNWKLENCRLVCGNCDMTLSTYKSRNKKSSRTKRYKRP